MRCTDCKDIIVGRAKRQMCGACYHRARRRGFTEPPIKRERTPKHGTWGEYNRYGCRCADCTEAMLVAKNKTLETNRRKFAEGTWEGKHGTLYVAKNLGCRCDECHPVLQEHNRTQWNKRVLKTGGKSEKSKGFWEKTKKGGYGVDVLHWPSYDENGEWTCPDCGLQLTRDVRSTTQQRNAA